MNCMYVLNMYDHVNYLDVIGKVSVISPFVWKDINGEQLKRRIIEIQDKRLIELNFFLILRMENFQILEKKKMPNMQES